MTPLNLNQLPGCAEIVGNNTERGGESVLLNSFQYTFQIYTLIYSLDIDH